MFFEDYPRKAFGARYDGDALVHAPELPLTGANSMKVGLALWQNMTVAPPPPSVTAASSLVTILVVCVLAYWLGRLPT